MGAILAQTGFLERLTFILIQMLYLTKMFIKHLKLSLVENADDKHNESSGEEDEEMKTEENNKDTLYRFVGHQSKVCIRKGLGIVKQLFDRYSANEVYIKDYSRQVYHEIISDQLGNMKTQVSIGAMKLIINSLLEIDLNFWRFSLNHGHNLP